MRNYFYGINRSANTNLNSFENRSILLSDNNKLSRYGSLSILSANRQSAVANQTVRFGAIDPRLTGQARMQAIEDRMNQVKAISGNNPNMKMTPEAWNLIAKGNAVELDIQLNAPDRRNLAITGLVGLTQVIGGLAGASYNKEQGALLTGRAKEDAEFVTKYGNSYDQGFFGIGAQYQDGEIKVRDLGAPQLEMQREQIAANIQQTQQDTNRTVRNSRVLAEQRAMNYEGRMGLNGDHQDTTVSKDGKTVETNATDRLISQYLSKKTDRELADMGLERSTITAIRNGRNFNVAQAQDLRTAGFSLGQESGGNRGIVTSIQASEANLRAQTPAGEMTRQATIDYLKVAQGAGVINQRDLQRFGVNNLDSLLNGGNEGAKDLSDLLKLTEQRIDTGTYADGRTVGNQTTYQRETDFKKDQMIGGQHITMLQYMANERMRLNTVAAQEMNDVANGYASSSISASTAQIYNQANGLTGQNALTADQLKSRIASGDFTGVREAIQSIKGDIGSVRNGLLNTASGMYASRNTVLAETLQSTDGTTDQGDLNRGVFPTSGTSTNRDFMADIKDFEEYMDYRQNDNSQSGNTPVTRIAVNGINIQDNIKGAAENLTSSLGDKTLSNASEVKNTFTAQLSQELIRGNIKQSDGSDFSQETIQRVSQAMAKGDVNNLTGAEKALYDKIKDNTDMKDKFNAVGNLFNKIDNNQQSSQIYTGAQNISTNIANLGSQLTAAKSNLPEGSLTTEVIRQRQQDVINRTTELSSALDTQNITKEDGSKFSRDDIQAVAKALTSGSTDSLNKDQKALYEKMASSDLKQKFSELGSAINDTTGGGSFAYLDPYKGPTMKELVENGIGADRAKELGISQRASLQERERYLDNGMMDPAKLKDKNNAQKFFANVSDLLNNRSLFNKNDSDTDDNRTIGEKITSEFIAIADQILSKLKNQNPYYYGFSQNATVSTSNYANSDRALSDIYNMALNTGIGIQSGIRQADKYTMRRDAEKDSKGEKVTIEEAMLKFKEKNKEIDAENARRVGTVNDNLIAGDPGQLDPEEPVTTGVA